MLPPADVRRAQLSTRRPGSRPRRGARRRLARRSNARPAGPPTLAPLALPPLRGARGSDPDRSPSALPSTSQIPKPSHRFPDPGHPYGKASRYPAMPSDTRPSLAGSGVAGLDDILRGGLPRGHVYLVEGDPGVGKTTLSLQFLLEGRRAGERTIYVTLSETKAELETVAASHGWSLDGIEIFELTPPEALGDEQNTLFHPSEVELAETTRAILNACGRINPDRAVF